MKLVRGSDLRLRLGLGNVDTLVAAADNAAEEATLHVESDLRTPLLQADYTDLYLITDSDRTRANLLLKSTAGFVASGWEVGTGLTKADAEEDTSLTELVVANLTRGTFLLTDQIVSKYVSIRYTAGFPEAASPNVENLFDLTDVPLWLTKLAEVKSIALLAASPDLDNKDGKLIDGKSFERQYRILMEDRMRYTPDARLPLG